MKQRKNDIEYILCYVLVFIKFYLILKIMNKLDKLLKEALDNQRKIDETLKFLKENEEKKLKQRIIKFLTI